jgi:uncharacterized protein (TIGR01777 family)
MRIAVAGASGLIGSALVPALRTAGHDVVRLVRRAPETPEEAAWDPAAGTIDEDALGDVGAIVNLAGANIGQRWTRDARRRILDSRVDGTRLLAETAARLEPRPALLLASAVGAYGPRGDEELTEESTRGEGFLADVVRAWEETADPARAAGVRVVHFRQGIVLSKGGGALARMLLPFRLGAGGRVGSGAQWWSWVALDDVVGAYVRAVGEPLEGVYNLASPGLTRNRDFVDALGRVLHRPTVLPLPGVAVRLLFGEMGEQMLLDGQRAVPARLDAIGFTFAYPEIEGALARALR